MVRCIQRAFPADLIVAEESLASLTPPQLAALRAYVEDVPGGEGAPPPGAASGRVWTIDPIDGTKGYVKESGGQYAVCIALLVDERPLLAAIVCPRLGPLVRTLWPGGAAVLPSDALAFMAIAGRGAFVAGLAGSGELQLPQRLPLLGPFEASPSSCVLAESAADSGHADGSFSDRFAARIAEALSREGGGGPLPQVRTVRIDSQAKYCLVASGIATALLRRVRPTRGRGYVERIWDHAPGSLLVSEAGGTVTATNDAAGRPLLFPTSSAMAGVEGILSTLFATRSFHQRLLAMLCEEEQRGARPEGHE